MRHKQPGRTKMVTGGKGMHGTYGKYRSKPVPGELTPKGGHKSSTPPGSKNGPRGNAKPH